MGGVGEDHSVVGYVDTHTLAKMPGNGVSEDRVKYQQNALRSGEGFKDPAMVLYDPKSSRAYVGEGNHRVEAAAREGVSHVPVRVVRTRFSDNEDKYVEHQGGKIGQLPTRASEFKGGLGEDYWPSDLHPSKVFPRDSVL